MNEDRLKGKWNQIKGELKKKWGKLTDDDLTYTEGHFDKMWAASRSAPARRRKRSRSSSIATWKTRKTPLT